MKKSKNSIPEWLDKHEDPEMRKLIEQQVKQIMAENNIEYQYLNLLQDILDNGVEKETRNGKTISVFGRQLRHKMTNGYPLLTTKKMAFKTMVTELLWFLRGDTNIKYLVDNNCHIWDGDAYKNYLIEDSKVLPNMSKEKMTELGYRLTKEEFINKIKTDDEFAKKWGDLGPIYGKQWRSWNGIDNSEMRMTTYGIDQIQNLINDLKTNPDSRRLMVSAWNVGELDQMVLQPCHYGFQVYTRELSESERFNWYGNKIGSHMHHDHIIQEMNENDVPKRAISLMWNQRSVDTFLGLPFNIASYGLLLEIIANEVNMVPDELVGNLGDTHLYSNHTEQAKEQLTREPMRLPTLKMSSGHNFRAALKGKTDEIDLNDFILLGYDPHPTIKAPLSN